MTSARTVRSAALLLVALALLPPAPSLADGELPAGEHALAWSGRDASGRALRAGLYFARLATADRGIVRRIVLAH